MNGRNRLVGDEAMTELVYQITDNAFRNEDEPMIAMVRDRMAGSDFDDLKPIFLPTDRAAGRARQILARHIEVEQSLAARHRRRLLTVGLISCEAKPPWQEWVKERTEETKDSITG